MRLARARVAREFVAAILCALLVVSCGGGPPDTTSSLELYAGSIGEIGGIDNTGTAARFFNPTGIAADTSGNLYVADTGNHSIRKISPAGSVSTLAGTAGAFGSIDAIGAVARFFNPSGVATDGSSNVYVADSYNHTIRKITPAGAVSTLAGTAGSSGATDGIGAAARFAGPQAVATDGTGNIYVADTYNHTIRKIVVNTGAVSTFAGTAGAVGSTDGQGAWARFAAPQGITCDSSGNVYVADTGNHTIRKITSGGLVSTLAGLALASGSADGNGAAARFFGPQGLTTDTAANVYVADTHNGTLRKITPLGLVSTAAGAAGQTSFAPGKLPAKVGSPIDLVVSGTSIYLTTGNGVALVVNRP